NESSPGHCRGRKNEALFVFRFTRGRSERDLGAVEGSIAYPHRRRSLATPANPTPTSPSNSVGGAGTPVVTPVPSKATSDSPVTFRLPKLLVMSKRTKAAVTDPKVNCCGASEALLAPWAKLVGPPARGVNVIPSVEVDTLTPSTPAENSAPLKFHTD